MIAAQLKKDIESFYQRCLKENPLFTRIMNGEVTVTEISQFTTDILYLISHTPIYLQLAEKIAREKNMGRIANYFEEKITEEEGHDEWAKNDLSKMKKSHAVNSTSVSGAMKKLVSYIEKTIRENPNNYVPYIFFAEYFTVIATPPLVGALKKNMQFDESMLSVFTNHAELDKHHVAEGMTAIDSIYSGKNDLQGFQKTLSEIFELYLGVGREVSRNKKAA